MCVYIYIYIKLSGAPVLWYWGGSGGGRPRGERKGPFKTVHTNYGVLTLKLEGINCDRLLNRRQPL